MSNQELDELAVQDDALVYAACSEKEIDWTGVTSDAEKACSGVWEYDAACCLQGYQDKSCDYPTGTYATRTYTVTVQPACHLVQECCDPTIDGWCPKPPCEYVEVCDDYQTPCKQAAQDKVNSFPAATLNIRGGQPDSTTPSSQWKPISIASAVASSPTCTIKLDNAPESWTTGQSPKCGPDTSKPIYGACSAGQTRVAPSYCGKPKVYSGLGVTREALKSSSTPPVENDPNYPVTCLSCEGTVLGTDATKLQTNAQAKYSCLSTSRSNLAAGQYPLAQSTKDAFDRELIGHLKLLLEYRGDLLTQSQRDAIVTLHHNYPGTYESCGSYWDAPLESDPIQNRSTFESATSPLSGWSVYGTASGSTTAYAGSYSAMLGSTSPTNGDSSIKRWFTVPSSGGTLSFWYRGACLDTASNDWATVTLEDQVNGAKYTVLPPTCSNSGTWAQVNYNLASVAGHRVILALTNHDNNVSGTATYTLFDEVSYPSIPKELEGTLQLCHRMVQDHVPAAVSQAAGAANSVTIAQRCVDNLGSAKGLASTYPTRSAYLDKARDTSVGVMKKAFSVVPGSDEAAHQPHIQRHLWTVARWYANAKSGTYQDDPACGSTDGGTADGGSASCGGTATEKLWKDASDVSGELYRGVNAGNIRTLELGTKDDAAVAAHLSAGMASDRELLKAMHTDYANPSGVTEKPMTTAPALLFFADGLRTVSDRLALVAPYHDLGCRFLGCKDSGYESEVTALHRILSNLHDKTELGNALTAADTLETNLRNSGKATFSTSWTDWRSVYGLVQQQHEAVLEAAVKDALGKSTYTPDLVTTATTSAPPPLLDLSGFIQQAAKRWWNYSGTGLLLKEKANGLGVGMLQSNIAQIRSNVAAAQTKLDDKRNEYSTNRTTLVDSLLAQQQSTQAGQQVESELIQLSQQMQALSADDLGLKLSGTIDASRFADMAEKYQEILANLPQDQQILPDAVLGPYSLSGGDARYAGGYAELTSVEVDTAKLPTVYANQPGEIINVDVQGTWAPTCALQRLQGSFYGVPVNPVTGANVALKDAQTGPQGYTFQYSSGSFSVTSNTDSRSSTWSGGVNACLGISFAKPLSKLFEFTASIDACGGYSYASSHVESDTNGSEARSSASFAVGLRLPNTPFPNLPAGSLLAVITPSNSALRSSVVDVRVIQAPRTTIVVTEPSQIHFVVNDWDCTSPGPGNLTMYLTRLVPKTEKMKQLGYAMQQVYDDFETKAAQYVVQGRLLSDDMALFRDSAWTALATKCQCNVSTYDEAVRGFFSTWLDSLVVSIQRQVELVSIRRDMDQLLLRNKALQADLASLNRQARLVRLMPTWTLRNLDHANSSLRDATSVLTRVVSEDLYPIVHLRYPDTLVDPDPYKDGVLEVAADRSKLEALVYLDWQSDSLLDLANAVDLATTAISDKLNTVSSSAVDGVVSRVVLRFENPFFPPVPDTLPYAGRKGDPSTARAIWEEIQAYGTTDSSTGSPHVPQKLRLTITPEDLYDSVQSNGFLSCNQVAPVIRTMALYVATQDPSAPGLNGDPIKIQTSLGQDLKYPLSGAIEDMVFQNEDWLTAQTKMLYGPEGASTDTLSQWLPVVPNDFTASLRGMSPFGSYELGPVNVWFNPYGDGTSLQLVMDLESRSKASGVSGVATCP